MKRSLFRVLLTLLFCPFLLLLMAGQTFAHSLSHTSYNCPLAGDHCYGQIQENASGQSSSGKFFGATTSIDARIISISSSSSAGFITDEMWFFDGGDSRCNLPFEGGGCWIEVGYTYDHDGEVLDGIRLDTLGTHAYWADARPNSSICGGTGCDYHEHVKGLFTIASSDVGKKMVVTVSAVGYKVATWTVSASLGSKHFTGYSTNNDMPGANSVQLGQELAGSGVSGINAVAPIVNFSSNKYQAIAVGPWSYYTSNVSPFSSGPPWSGWVHFPSSSYPGGTVYTYTL